MKFWTPETIELSYYTNIWNRRDTSTKKSGMDRSGLCTYDYNELGFRGDSIKKEGFKIMSIGCSNTEGVGVSGHETWPNQFSSLIPNSVDMNFGNGGRSNEFMSRALITYFDIIKPDLVLVMYTEPHRRDYFTKYGTVEPYHAVSWGWYDIMDDGRDAHRSLLTLSNDEYDFQNWYKSHLLIKYFLESKKCNWLWNGWHLSNNYYEENRFDGDFCPFLDYGTDNCHPGPKTNEAYSKKLYDHIKIKFPEYLPTKDPHIEDT